MPLTHHDDIELVAGDDWSITGVLLDVDGSSLDLTGASFEWTLIDPNGDEVSDLVGATTVSAISPSVSGQVQILIPAQFTAPLEAGRFHDALRVKVGYKTTFWVGTVLVNCNVFSLIEPFIPTGVGVSSSNLATGTANLGTPTLVHS